MTAYVSRYLTYPLRTEAEVRAMRSCGDCDGKGTIVLAGDVVACPSCRPEDFARACEEQRIELGNP